MGPDIIPAEGDAPRLELDDQSLADLLEQVSRQLDENSAIDVEELARAYPHFADRLRELMPTMAALASWGRGEDASLAEQATGGTDAHVSGTLGDFRIIRELGRGGMGTVFEAEQISMGRRVALKVLPFAALANDKSLQRFRNEVRAVAALDYPHIVSVYSVGEERGIHYYSMQLIRGQTLAEFIGRLRHEAPPRGGQVPAVVPSLSGDRSTLPDEQAYVSTAIAPRRKAEHYRNAARLGIEAAGALQHAHEQGVLHRDVKPGNLLLDAEGKLHVTDFGLARIEADAGMTMTGDLVGTLRYMSPEQALAKRAIIDHRSDIYSLGVTLYELLALRPAFHGDDQQEVLQRIALEEPTALRKIDSSIPVELETIVHKAAAKRPEDRYASAQELADDLRRWLDHRAIHAKPPTALQRTRNWARRNRPLVNSAAGSLAAVIMIAFAILATSNARIRQESDARLAALDAKNAAIREKDSALAAARTAVDEMLVKVAFDRLDGVPDAQPIRDRLISDALRFYDEFIGQSANDPRLARTRADMLRVRAKIHAHAGHNLVAAEGCRDAIAAYQALIVETPNDPVLLEELADAYCHLQSCITNHREAGQYGKTDRTDRVVARAQAKSIHERLRREWPERLPRDGYAIYAVAREKLSGDPETVRRLCHEAIASFEREIEHWEGLGGSYELSDYWMVDGGDPLRTARDGLGWATYTLTEILERQNSRGDHTAEIERLVNAALIHVDRAIAQEVDDGSWHVGLYLRNQLGQALARAGRDDEAVAVWLESIPSAFRACTMLSNYPILWKTLRRSFKDANDALSGQAWLDVLAVIQRETDALLDTPFPEESTQADALYSAAIVARYLWDEDHRNGAGDFVTRIAKGIEELESESCCGDATEVRLASARSVLPVEPLTEQQAAELGDALAGFQAIRIRLLPDVTEEFDFVRDRARQYRDLGRFDEALADLDAAVAARPSYHWILRQRADLHAVIGNYEQAVADAENSVKLGAHWPWAPSNWYDGPDSFRQGVIRVADQLVKKTGSADAYHNRGKVHFAIGDYQSALVDFSKVIQKAGSAEAYRRRGRVQFELGDYDSSLADFSKAIELDPDDPQHWDCRWRCRGDAYARLGRWEEARQDFARAVALFPDAPTPHFRLAEALCQLEQWEHAAAELVRITELAPGAAGAYYQAALAELGAKKVDRFRVVCATLTERFHDTDDPSAASWVAWTCALAPAAIADLRPAVEAGRKAQADEQNAEFAQRALGGVLYRAGQHEEAKTMLLRSLQSHGAVQSSRAYAQYFLAMTEFQLGDLEKAQEHLDAANEQAEAELATGPPWNRRLTLELFQSEATELLTASGPAD